MSNWQLDYRVKYHVTFQHNDGRTEAVTDSAIIEARSLEEAEAIILHQYEHNGVPLAAFPDGWHGEIKNEKLEIDEIIKVWEY